MTTFILDSLELRLHVGLRLRNIIVILFFVVLFGM